MLLLQVSSLLLVFHFLSPSSAQCQVKTEPGYPDRTLCKVEKLEEDDPIKLEHDHQNANNNKTLDFLYMDISHGEIPTDAFAKLKARKELWFLGDNITYIQPGAFSNLTDLANLAITNTLISNISVDTFTGVPNLVTLSLIKNKIKHIEDGAFNGLGNLQQLLLNENNLSRLNATTFRGLENVQAIFIDDNPIEFVHDDAFRHLKNLTHLTISLLRGSHLSGKFWDFLPEDRKIIHYL